ncbi:transcription termination/antitermination NusG family protein [uncultured Zoogloea sp.]|uniref:transcription termination/antitermination protein NusG n=1 Tax=uncultured Zoogloea sp. TaxID=160237 RepID=UPI0026223849|nr:transcription termination/antitermination NusG family protein [uncultured Zoogloea sp.]
MIAVALAEPVVAELPAPAEWFMLRVDPRRPSLGACHARPLRAVPRADVTRAPVGGIPAIASTPTRAEFVVEAALRRRGLDAWVPVESRFHRHNRYHRGAKKLVVVPILTGYVLARVRRALDWLAVLDCPMVRGVMGFGGVPARLPAAAIGRLREIEDLSQARAYHRLMPTRRAYEVGELVEVLDGPMEGFHVEVLAITSQAARVLFHLFGRETEAILGLDKIGSLE